MTDQQKADSIWKAHQTFMVAYGALCFAQPFYPPLAIAFYASIALITASWALCGGCPLRIWEFRLRNRPFEYMHPVVRVAFGLAAVASTTFVFLVLLKPK